MLSIVLLITAQLRPRLAPVDLIVFFSFVGAAGYLVALPLQQLRTHRPITISDTGVRTDKCFLRWTEIDCVEAERWTPFTVSNAPRYTYRIIGKQCRIPFSQFINGSPTLIDLLNVRAREFGFEIRQRDFGRDARARVFATIADAPERRRLYKEGIVTVMRELPRTGR